jgi:hypothetical protein
MGVEFLKFCGLMSLIVSHNFFQSLFRAVIVLALFSICAFQFSAAMAQGTAFTYQGQLSNNGSAANGSYDLAFAIYGSAGGSDRVAGPITNSAVVVSNGLFTTILDFGANVFTGPDYWLQISVSVSRSNNFTALNPRQLLTPTPYAIFASASSNLVGSLPAAQLSGALPSAQISGAYSGAVAFNNNANNFNGTFSGAFGGNGASLTNLNAAQIASGTVADARLSGNVAFLNGNQTFSGANAFTNFGNSFHGSFFGNGLIGWVVVPGTSLQAAIDTGYVLTNSQVVTVTLPTNANIGDIVRISGAGTGGWQIAQNTNQSILGNFSGFAESLWTPTAASKPLNWDSIAASPDGTKLIASAFSGEVYVSVDAGETWAVTNATAGMWRSVACSADGNKLFAALFGGGIYTNSASNWGIGGSTSGLDWISIACSADGTKLVAAANGQGIYTSGDSGTTWKKQTTGLPSGTPNWYYVASSANGTNLAAVINGGDIYTSANAGASWTKQTAGLPANPDWISIASSSDGGKLAAVAVSGGIYTSVNSGANWSRQTNGAPANLSWSSIASSSDGSKLAASVLGGGIYFSANSGATWIQVNAPANNWYATAASADGSRLFATIYGGGIYTAQVSSQSPTTTPAINGIISGNQGSAVELQYIGNGQFMPLSSTGLIWAN